MLKVYMFTYVKCMTKLLFCIMSLFKCARFVARSSTPQVLKQPFTLLSTLFIFSAHNTHAC